MTNPLTPTRSSAILELDHLADSLHTLFHGSAEGKLAKKNYRQTRDEIIAIEINRGLHLRIVAVLGSKNAGKSWLCRRLISDPAHRDQIPSGEEHEFSTSKAIWIGPDAPATLDPTHEEKITVPRSVMVDLGRDYVLLDLPGYNDAGIADREAALRAVRGAGLRVLVISSQTLEAESQLAYLTNSDGTRILPVVVDNHFPNLTDNNSTELIALREKIARHCPQADVLPPLVIPHSEHASGDPSELSAIADRILFPVLTEALAAPEMDPSSASRIVIERFRRQLAHDLGGILSGIEPAWQRLIDEEAGLTAKLMGKIVGTENQLRAGIRMKMRLATLACTPAIFFPYRTFLGVLALTAGAWDRLAFALAGSIPSLALLAFQTTRNLAKIGEMRHDIKNALSSRMEAMARDALAVRNEQFTRATREFLPANTREPSDEASKAKLLGLDRVTQESAAIFEETIQRHAVGNGLVWLLGSLATLLFLGLAIGPTYAIYREFFAAWFGAVHPDTHLVVTWKNFPIPAGGMIFSTLLLMILPAFVCALLTMAWVVPRNRVDAAIATAQAAHENLLAKLTQEKAIRLISDDPTREAIRSILDFTKAQR